MSIGTEREQALLAKIRDLSDERLAQVEEFVDFLQGRDERLALAEAAVGPSGSASGAGNGVARRTDDEPARTLKRLRDADRMDRIYEQYVKPVEQEHWGEYVVVTPDGRTFFALTMLEAVQKSDEVRNPDNCLFKVGAIAAVSIL
jgi:hypothetical protein